MDILEQTIESSNEDIELKNDGINLKEEAGEDPKHVDSNLTIIDEDGSLSDEQAETLAHAQAILEADDDVQYQWKSDNGVTYRVYQVNPDDQEGESVASDFQSSTPHMQPVVLTSNLASNHFYVVGNDVLASQTARSLVPRSNVVIENRAASSNPTRVRRDDRRRATHNEVERRRRDKINNWILKLSKIIPECNSMDNNKSVQSKGGILAKACDYILELRGASQKLDHAVKENERLANHCEYLRTLNEKLKLENSLLRQRSGVVERRPTQES